MDCWQIVLGMWSLEILKFDQPVNHDDDLHYYELAEEFSENDEPELGEANDSNEIVWQCKLAEGRYGHEVEYNSVAFMGSYPKADIDLICAALSIDQKSARAIIGATGVAIARWYNSGAFHDELGKPQFQELLKDLVKFLEAADSVAKIDMAKALSDNDYRIRCSVVVSNLGPIFSKLNPRWANLTTVDFRADADAIAEYLKPVEPGRRPDAERHCTEAAEALIDAWVSDGGQPLSKGTGQRSPFRVLKRIAENITVLDPLSIKTESPTEIPDHLNGKFVKAIFAGEETPTLLKAIDARQKADRRARQGQPAQRMSLSSL